MQYLIIALVGICCNILYLLQYLNKFDLAPVFSEEEFRHWFIPRPSIVDSFVVEVKPFFVTFHCGAKETVRLARN